jgi:asparaginyl-tRNA synthetase
MRVLIKHLLNETSNYSLGNQVCIKGWVRTLRDQKQFAFIELNDGSSLANIQVIANQDLENFAEIIETVNTGAALEITGKLVESPGKDQSIEIHAQQIKITGLCDSSFPLQKKRHSFEFLRTIAHLRPRTNTLGAIARIRNALSFSSHRFFQERDFIYVNTPIITSSDCEGAGEMFKVTTLDLNKIPRTEGNEIDFSQDFFGRAANLTVSGQLESELAALALSEVYTFGPTFRAENSNTTRHLAEFWMIEPEMAFYDLDDNQNLVEEMLKYLVKYALDNCTDDLAFLNQMYDKELLQKLSFVVDNDFKRVTYTEGVEILKTCGQKFEFPVDWGTDLQSEHERYLVEKHFKCPVILTNYPKHIKAFYMKQNDDGKTVRAMDVLFPGIGEIVGGSQREENLEKLQAAMAAFHIPEKEMFWYLDTRRFGTAPHAGFGLGFERLILFITGMSNIRDVIPFPRTPMNCEF